MQPPARPSPARAVTVPPRVQCVQLERHSGVRCVHAACSMPLPGFAARVQMYAMLIGYVACFKVPRFAINTLIPFVVRVSAPSPSERAPCRRWPCSLRPGGAAAQDMGLPTAITPTLLAAFHPGYICSQIPGAAVVRRSGPKFLATLQLVGCAVFTAAMPSAGNIRSRGAAVAALSGLMACLGVVQGPMSPVISQLNSAWMPTGVERAIAFRFTGLAHTVGVRTPQHTATQSNGGREGGTERHRDGDRDGDRARALMLADSSLVLRWRVSPRRRRSSVHCSRLESATATAGVRSATATPHAPACSQSCGLHSPLTGRLLNLTTRGPAPARRNLSSLRRSPWQRPPLGLKP